MKKVFWAIYVFVFCNAGAVWADATTDIWTNIYNSGNDHQYAIPWSGSMTTNQDYAIDTAIDSQGNFIVVGYRAGDTSHAYNGYAVKYNRSGNILCTVELDSGAILGPYESSGPAGYSTDSFSAVAVDSQDNIILGASKSGNYYISGYWQEAWLMKYSPTCQTLWASPVEYSGTPDFYDSAWNSVGDITVDADDNIYVAGSTFGGWSNGEGWWFAFKYDSDGAQDTSFKVLYDSWPTYTTQDMAFGIAVDSTNNVIVAGRRGAGEGNIDWHVRKYGPTGTLLWQHSYDDPNHLHDFSWTVKVDGNDDVVVAGYVNAGTDHSTGANYNWQVMKYAKDGSAGIGIPLWATSYTFDAPAQKSDNINNGLAIGRNNNVWIGGIETDSSGIIHRRLALLDTETGGEFYSKAWPSNTNNETIYGLAFRNDALVAVGGSHNGTYWDWLTTTFSTVTFADVVDDFWAEDYIRSIYYYGITTGCTQDPLNYCPPNPVSRQAMSAFIVRAVEGEPPADYCDSGSPFTDVPKTSQFCKYIKRMYELKITTGCTATEYCPFNPVSRQAMAAFIIRALDEEPAADYCDSGSPFTDVPTDSQFCRHIKRFSELGITTGCTATEYCRFNNVTRAAMAAFLSRAFLGME